jgi:hypothetical protein
MKWRMNSESMLKGRPSAWPGTGRLGSWPGRGIDYSMSLVGRVARVVGDSSSMHCARDRYVVRYCKIVNNNRTATRMR